jgi:hypothetical protein
MHDCRGIKFSSVARVGCFGNPGDQPVKGIPEFAQRTFYPGRVCVCVKGGVWLRGVCRVAFQIMMGMVLLEKRRQPPDACASYPSAESTAPLWRVQRYAPQSTSYASGSCRCPWSDRAARDSVLSRRAPAGREVRILYVRFHWRMPLRWRPQGDRTQYEAACS